MLPSKDQLTICFAHVAYRLGERFLTLATGIGSFEVRDGSARTASSSATPMGSVGLRLFRGGARPSIGGSPDDPRRGAAHCRMRTSQSNVQRHQV
jgi:hypothetical protein